MSENNSKEIKNKPNNTEKNFRDKIKEIIEGFKPKIKESEYIQILEGYINHAVGRADRYEDNRRETIKISLSVLIALTTIVLLIINLINNPSSQIELRIEYFSIFIVGSIILIFFSIIVLVSSLIEMPTRIIEEDLYHTLGHYKGHVHGDNKREYDDEYLIKFIINIKEWDEKKFIIDHMKQLYIIFRHQVHYHKLARIFNIIFLIGLSIFCFCIILQIVLILFYLIY